MPEFVFGSLEFDSTGREVIANQIGEVLPVLEFAEREAKAGSYVAVMLSYEAAPAFDSVLAVHEPSDYSTAEREYEECLVKSRFLNAPAVEFQLFESMLLEDSQYFLFAEHLE